MLKKIALAAVLAVGSTATQSGKVAKILAGTTNGLFANQLFGITFGTLGCSGTGTVTAQAVTFTNENAEALARDMAVGEGESLNVLAELLNIQSEDKARFFEVSKQNFAKIYSAENQDALQVLASLQAVMATDSVLKAYV